MLPCINKFEEEYTLSQAQLRASTALIYLCTLCFIFLLAMALTNTWKFLIKQQKYKNWTLLTFYILVIMLASFRIYDSFFYFCVGDNMIFIVIILNPTLKLNIGAVQCWVLIELALKVTLNIRLTESNNKQLLHRDDLGAQASIDFY